MPKRGAVKDLLILMGMGLPLPVIHYLIARSSTWLIPMYALSFLCYLWLWRKSSWDIKTVFVWAVVLRLSLCFGWPGLSDDSYRFIWDGQLTANGVNPYLKAPSQLVESLPAEYEGVYEKLNSPDYHSTYPPLSQYVFSLSSWLGLERLFWHITVLRCVLFVFDIGVILLLTLLAVRTRYVMLYAFNPLVILELTGNLHFEGVVVFFLLGAIWCYQNGYWKTAAGALSLGIMTKLTPLMFLPLLMRKLNLKQAAVSYLLIFVVILFLCLPFFDTRFLTGFANGLDLFFRKFEFNAGLFFLLRALGFWWQGYDVVQSLGPWLSVVALFLILAYSWGVTDKEASWPRDFTVVLFIQLIFATTVHPWYVIPLVAWSSLTGYAFPIVWSGLIFLSYIGYHDQGYDHPFFMIALEYMLIAGLAGYETVKHKPLLDEA